MVPRECRERSRGDGGEETNDEEEEEKEERKKEDVEAGEGQREI